MPPQLTSILLLKIDHHPLLVMQLRAEGEAELVDISIGRGKILLGEIEERESKRGYFLYDAFVISDDINLKLQILIKLLLVIHEGIELLLKHAIPNLIPHGYDEPILLPDEPPMDIREVFVPLVVHVHLTHVHQPFVHHLFVVEVVDLRQDLVDRLLCYLFLQVPRHLDELVRHRKDLTHRNRRRRNHHRVVRVDLQGRVFRSQQVALCFLLEVGSLRGI